ERDDDEHRPEEDVEGEVDGPLGGEDFQPRGQPPERTRRGRLGGRFGERGHRVRGGRRCTRHPPQRIGISERGKGREGERRAEGTPKLFPPFPPPPPRPPSPVLPPPALSHPTSTPAIVAVIMLASVPASTARR